MKLTEDTKLTIGEILDGDFDNLLKINLGKIPLYTYNTFETGKLTTKQATPERSITIAIDKHLRKLIKEGNKQEFIYIEATCQGETKYICYNNK